MERGIDVRPSRPLPERMFAMGEELVGVRVTPYHKPDAISKIITALEDEEVDVLRRGPFGKLVDIAEKPTFSGRFVRYIISRQLKVRKRHEAWFLFAGKPVRFSLREFALVTGLNCGPYPSDSKKTVKKAINEKPYWCELFGTMKEVSVSCVVRMLKRRSVTEKDTRIKYALLALLASVILPTTHTPRISQEHAEKIKDLDGFLSYPWGRLSFDLLMSSIKERNEVSLSQNTIALKGFVLALQLVMIEVVPALTEGVHDGASADSEGEIVYDDDLRDEERKGKRSISPGHARETDVAGKAGVISIISVKNNDYNDESHLRRSDDEEDVTLDYMLELIEDGFPFTPSCFTGGASKEDVAIMREETKTEAEVRKTTKHKSKQTTGDLVDAEYIATAVKARVSVDLRRIETEMKILRNSFENFQTHIVSNIEDMLNKFQGEIVKSLAPQELNSSARRKEDMRQTLPATSCIHCNLGASTTLNAGAYINDNSAEKEVRNSWDDISIMNAPRVNDLVSTIPGSTPAHVDASQIIENAVCFAQISGIAIDNIEPISVTQTKHKDIGPTMCSTELISSPNVAPPNVAARLTVRPSERVTGSLLL